MTRVSMGSGYETRQGDDSKPGAIAYSSSYGLPRLVLIPTVTWRLAQDHTVSSGTAIRPDVRDRWIWAFVLLFFFLIFWPRCAHVGS